MSSSRWTIDLHGRNDFALARQQDHSGLRAVGRGGKQVAMLRAYPLRVGGGSDRRENTSG